MTTLTSGHICPCCGYRVPVQTITTTTGTGKYGDYVEVIRCKDCKHYNPLDFRKPFCCNYGVVDAMLDDFCSRAERKEHETD